MMVCLDHMPSIWCILLFPLLFFVDILLNRSQQLFASCTAKFADGQQCSIPVFDITHQTPLCEEHAKKMVGSISHVNCIDCAQPVIHIELYRSDSESIPHSFHTG